MRRVDHDDAGLLDLGEDDRRHHVLARPLARRLHLRISLALLVLALDFVLAHPEARQPAPARDHQIDHRQAEPDERGVARERERGVPREGDCGLEAPRRAGEVRRGIAQRVPGEPRDEAGRHERASDRQDAVDRQEPTRAGERVEAREVGRDLAGRERAAGLHGACDRRGEGHGGEERERQRQQVRGHPGGVEAARDAPRGRPRDGRVDEQGGAIRERADGGRDQRDRDQEREGLRREGAHAAVALPSRFLQALRRRLFGLLAHDVRPSA